MPESYDDLRYLQLKTLCAKRGLGGKGTRPELLSKLALYDQEVKGVHAEEEFVAVDRAGRPLVKRIPPGKKLTDPDPQNMNYDLGGKWRRRSPKWIGWDENGEAKYKEK